MSIASKLVTAEEFYILPGDGMRRELIDGRVYAMSPAGYAHGIVAANIGAAVLMHVRQNGLGKTFGAETGFIVHRDPDTVMAPDCAFVRNARLAAVKTLRGFCGAHPDLAVEVISPNETRNEVAAKAKRWIDAGVEVVWVFDPELKQVTIYEGESVVCLTADHELVAKALLPGFRVSLAEIFDS